MKIYKFFRFTIKGDELDPNAVKEAVSLPCDVFFKGETVISQDYLFEHYQITNRWLYSDELLGKSSVRVFLTKQLETINKNLPELREFLDKYDSNMELVLYAENKTDITLTLKQIRLLEKIGVEFSISFC
ncbi:MAG: DUF4279 domain-containing protein [Coriobacteriia bacterium]|nr:DUF4279 domain-containing protein [Coriobacteriia bacterium]